MSLKGATLAGHAKAAPVAWTRAGRWYRVRRAVTVAMLVAGVARFGLWLTLQAPVDWVLYRDAALRWEAGGSYFMPHQLAGPYTLGHGEPLYPPVILWLLVPFAHLPAILWWVVPVAILVAVLWRMRPNAWAVLVIAFLLMTPAIQNPYLTGRPTIWMPAFLALGLLGGGWAALVLLKPSLLPFALVGIRRRWWWVTLAALVLLSVPFGLTIWSDWITAVRNSDGGLLYSLQDVPLMLVPVIAYLGRTSRRGAAPAGSGSVLSRLTRSAPASES